jgi:heme-degrading monooxygenase HmoA
MSEHVRIWRYRVRGEKSTEFRSIYGATGAWVRLFASAPGYLGTELLEDEADPFSFATIDRWQTPEAFEWFKKTFADAYRELDEECAGLTEEESFVGAFTAI